MRNIIVDNMKKIKRAIPSIENKVNVKIGFGKNKVSVKGAELNEFLVENIIRAIDFGFDIDDALLLLNTEFVLEFIEVKEHTRRKNLKDVRSRIIGRDGRAKRTIEKLTESAIVINGNNIGVIVDAEHLSTTIQGIEKSNRGFKTRKCIWILRKTKYKNRKKMERIRTKEHKSHRRITTLPHQYNLIDSPTNG